MKLNVMLIWSFLLFSCAKQVNTQDAEQSFGPWLIEEKSVDEGKLQIRMRNASENTLVVHDPMERKISVNSGANWESVRVLYCDCGVSCAPPPSRLPIETNGVYTLSWDFHSEDCVSGQGTQSTTVRKRVSKGMYQIEITYSISGTRERQTIALPFQVD